MQQLMGLLLFFNFAVIAIKNGNRKLHERLIKICIALSLLFLVLYIAYHITTDPTSYGGEGLINICTISF